MKNPNQEAETTFLNTLADAVSTGRKPTPEEQALDQKYSDSDPSYDAQEGQAFIKGEQAWETAHPGQVNPATGLGGSVDGIPAGLTDDDETGDALGIDPCLGFGTDDDENAPGSDL